MIGYHKASRRDKIVWIVIRPYHAKDYLIQIDYLNCTVSTVHDLNSDHLNEI